MESGVEPVSAAAAVPGQESGSARHRRRLAFVLALTTTYLVVEVIGGVITGSLALIADAGHMLTDAMGLALALFAIWFGSRPATPQRTFGFYRAEILAALTNAIVLFLVAGYILFEAYRRFQSPPEIESGPMMIVAAVGLLINLIGAWLLQRAAGESLNMQGAFLEVISDTLGSLGVIIAGAITFFTGWPYADPLFSVFIGVFIIPRTWRLLRESVGILLEGTPARLNLAEIRAAMEAVPGVESVHDLHAWSITSGMDALSAHARLRPGAGRGETLTTLAALLSERFGIEHTTIQLEEPDHSETQRHA